MALDSNSKQRIPDLFREIMRVDDEILNVLHQQPEIFTSGELRVRYLELKSRKDALRKAAEIALAWNHNKGNSGNG